MDDDSRSALLDALDEAERRGVRGLAEKVRALERLVEISRRISTLELETVLELILSSVLELTGTQRGALLLADHDEQLHVTSVFNLAAEEVASRTFAVSRSVAERAFARADVIIIEDAPRSDVQERTSVVSLGLKALAAIPLPGRTHTLGVLYVDTDADEHALGRSDRSTLLAFGAQAALAIDNARLHDALRQDYVHLQGAVAETMTFPGLLYRSAVMDRVCRLMERAAASEITVLIEGETGTGKELVARGIHRAGGRSGRRFVVQNVGAMPETLIESELFGHRRGAFSGAVENRAGLFEVADGGTVFLDEIGEASPAVQVSLLRLLEAGTYRRVGETVDRSTDVRVIAATNRDLAAEVEAGRFRRDLYYRLSVFPIVLPPLRERREDIPLLVQHFVEHYNRALDKTIRAIPERTFEILRQRPWQGNVRELKNCIYRLMVLAPGDALPEPEPLATDEPEEVAADEGESIAAGEGLANLATLAEVERRHIRHALALAGGNRTHAARHLGLKRGTLRWRMKKLRIDP